MASYTPSPVPSDFLASISGATSTYDNNSGNSSCNYNKHSSLTNNQAHNNSIPSYNNNNYSSSTYATGYVSSAAGSSDIFAGTKFAATATGSSTSQPTTNGSVIRDQYEGGYVPSSGGVPSSFSQSIGFGTTTAVAATQQQQQYNVTPSAPAESYYQTTQVGNSSQGGTYNPSNRSVPSNFLPASSTSADAHPPKRVYPKPVPTPPFSMALDVPPPKIPPTTAENNHYTYTQ